MKKPHSFLMALCAATILSPAVAASAIEQQADPAGADSRPAVKSSVTPHNHMRDGKGMSIPEKAVEPKKETQPAALESETAKPAAEKKGTARKKLRPHSHPQDGKGMYVPEKK